MSPTSVTSIDVTKFTITKFDAYIPSKGNPLKLVSAEDEVFDEQDDQNQVQSDEMKMEQILEEEATRKRILKYRRLSINS